jgi:carbonic anhydrase
VGVTDQLVSSNAAFAEEFDRSTELSPPKLGVAILTCIDSRLHPERFLGLEVGDAHIIRNAGGRASEDALRSLIISSVLLGTREFLVIHHTDCGMLTFTNEDVWSKLEADTGHSARDIDFLPFADLEQSVHDDVGTIRANSFLPPDIQVSGWLYDVKSGRIEPVVDA